MLVSRVVGGRRALGGECMCWLRCPESATSEEGRGAGEAAATRRRRRRKQGNTHHTNTPSLSNRLMTIQTRQLAVIGALTNIACLSRVGGDFVDLT